MPMLTDREITLRDPRLFDLIVAIKNTIHVIYSFGLKLLQSDDYRIVFFIGNRHLDPNTQSFITETYVLPIASASDISLQEVVPAIQVNAAEN
jgi:hypothetical protein